MNNTNIKGLVSVLVVQLLMATMIMGHGHNETWKDGAEICYQCNGEDCKHLNEKCSLNETSSCYIMSYGLANSTIFKAGCTNLKCNETSGQNELCSSNSNSTSCNVLSCCDEDFCNDIDHVIGSGDTAMHSGEKFFVVLLMTLTTFKML